jgi:hypothetical protein
MIKDFFNDINDDFNKRLIYKFKLNKFSYINTNYEYLKFISLKQRVLEVDMTKHLYIFS